MKKIKVSGFFFSLILTLVSVPVFAGGGTSAEVPPPQLEPSISDFKNNPEIQARVKAIEDMGYSSAYPQAIAVGGDCESQGSWTACYNTWIIIQRFYPIHPKSGVIKAIVARSSARDNFAIRLIPEDRYYNGMDQILNDPLPAN